MTTRAGRRAALAMLGVFVASASSTLMLAAANANLSAQSGAFLFAFAAFMVVGALVVARRPENPVGWLFSAVGLLFVTGWLAQEYAEYTYVTSPGSLPAGILAAWYAGWYWFPLIGSALVFPLLLFPTGRPPSPRWKPVLWVAVLAVAGITVLAMLKPVLDLQDVDYEVPNPIGVASVGNLEETVIGNAFFFLLLATLVAAFVSLVFRFRRSSGEERQQLKWFTYGGALVVVSPMSDLLPITVEAPDFLTVLFLAVPPVAAGIAVLKYRLYDIDIIIRRTLIYGTLTATLALAYFGSVVVLQTLLRPLVGTETQLATVASTLASVALFHPLRRRIQAVIDRRFYRRKYDAQQTLLAFGERLRDETDLQQLLSGIVEVAQGTLQPAHVSLWLREGSRRSVEHQSDVS